MKRRVALKIVVAPLAVLAGMGLVTAQAQQVPIPMTAAEVPAPPPAPR